VSPDDPTQALTWLPASQLQLSPLYRQLPDADAGKLRELAVSIAREGVLQPLLVTPSAEAAQYEVIAGRRRLLAAHSTSTALPALVRQLSPRQKHQAFLAANVCTALPASMETLTSAYDATWTTIPDELAEEPHAIDGEHSDRVTAVLAQVRQLSPFLRRHIARALVTADDTLVTGLLAEARQQLSVSEASDCQRLEQELAVAQQAVRDAQLQHRRHTETLEQLGQQLTEARVRSQRSEEQRHELEQLQQTLTHDNRQLRAQMQTVTARLAAVGPMEQLAGTPRVATILQTVMDVVAAAGPPLITQAIRLLDPRTSRDATTSLTRALRLVEERLRACQLGLAEDHCVTKPPQSSQILTQEESA
jgi:hypothetical protein